MKMEEKDRDPVALHVIVVGFHHKKGMQVKSIILYCYCQDPAIRLSLYPSGQCLWMQKQENYGRQALDSDWLSQDNLSCGDA